ncbi:MAG: TetR/AcrR family transcriptional regulator [Nocardioides sp.]|uniref:TetR/AcrR family transcriptional regulator n=1 Tax=Nocardioides sp. TaxID=35761 RepID=UPI0023897DBD|nr:TetR/AcrR family transcriptional regulator [Nocardioides sp.]MDE0777881.1 TetR/AcrR family transcriptional regulator [Nocardioides sp.]
MVQRQRIRPTQARAVQMRRALLDATVQLLERPGGRALSTTAIVRRAHVSSGTFYRYFNDKAEILTVLRDEAVVAIKADLMSAVVAALDLEQEDALRLVVEALVTAFERHRAVIGAVVEQLPAGPNANVLPEIEADLHQLASLLPRRHRPDLSAEELEAVVFLTMGVLVSTCLRISLHRPAQVDREGLIELATRMLTAGLSAGRADDHQDDDLPEDRSGDRHGDRRGGQHGDRADPEG